jgi:hypothetical protein
MSDNEKRKFERVPFDDFIKDPDEPEWDAEQLEKFLVDPDRSLVRSEIHGLAFTTNDRLPLLCAAAQTTAFEHGAITNGNGALGTPSSTPVRRSCKLQHANSTSSMIAPDTNVVLMSQERRKKQSRKRQARYRHSLKGQATKAAYDRRPSTKLKKKLFKRRYRETIECRAQDLHDKAHQVARRKKEKCTVTVEEIRRKLRPLRCVISGSPLELKQRPEFSRNPFSPSLDKTNRLGKHTDNNTRITCTLVNTAMNEWGVEYFQEIAFLTLLKSVPADLRRVLKAWRQRSREFGVQR